MVPFMILSRYKYQEQHIEMREKFRLMSCGLLYTIFLFLAQYGVVYTNPSFVNNSEFIYTLLTFIVEIIDRSSKLEEVPIVCTIILSGIIGNYGLMGISSSGIHLGYIFVSMAHTVEVINSYLINKASSKTRVINFLYFAIGLFLSSSAFLFIESTVLQTPQHNFSNMVYLCIIANSLYIFGYFFVIDFFGMVYDSVACSMAIIYTLIFTLATYEVNDTMVACCGVAILLINALAHTHAITIKESQINP